MFSLLLLLLTMYLSAIVTRIGAIALEITGLREDHASFQSLSAFSGSGFTTQESELAVSHPERRKIIKNLMRYGKAGVITTMATGVGALVAGPKLFRDLSENDIAPWLPVNLNTLILIGIILVVYLVERTLSRPSVARLIKELITQVLLQEHIVSPVQYEELHVCSSGYGVLTVGVCERNPLLGKRLGETDLQEKNIQILNVDRLLETIDQPGPATKVQLGDRLLCYGPMAALTGSCCAPLAPGSGTMHKSASADEPLPLGSAAPEISLLDQTGHPFNLSDYRGSKNVIVVFYPKDKTYTCSSQLRQFEQHRQVLADLDTLVVAVNTGSIKSHADFAREIDAQFPILSDSDRKTSKAYKALMLGGLLVNRTVYVIDKAGKIVYAKRGNPSILDVMSVLQGKHPAGITCELFPTAP